MSTTSLWAAAEANDAVDVRALRGQTVTVTTGAIAILALGMLAFAAFGLNRVDEELFVVIVGLAVVAGIAHGVERFGLGLTSGCLVGGLLAILMLALHTMLAPVIAPWAAVVILIAGALLGWQWGVVTATMTSGVLWFATSLSWTSLDADSAISAVLLGWAGLFVCWMITRPIRTALDSASISYVQARSAMQEARARQAELARLSKSLSVSYHLVEQLNLEVERARRAAEEARRLKAQFAAAVSHELRTPLNLVIGFCEMMVRSPSAAYGRRLPSGYRDDLEAIYRNAYHISALVDDILDLSQIDADRMALHRTWVAMDQVVADAVAPVHTLFRDRSLILEVDIAGDLPPVYVDRTRIGQILINLLNNAARVTDEGGVTVHARRDGKSMVITVTDSGPGIALDELPYVFEEFYQTGGSVRRRGGSGLGLAISKAFAELHQGTMWVESTLGQGTTFGLRFPISEDAAPADAPAHTWGAPLAARVHGQAERRVLVLDRQGEMHHVFERYLDGYHVLGPQDLHRDGEDCAGEPLHAVVIGSAAARDQWRLLARSIPEWQRLPIINCPLRTAHRTADELGVSDYLVKPVTREQLRSAFQRLGRTIRYVLVVEDDADMLSLLARTIRSIVRRVEVATAGDGEEALARMRERLPDAVVLDLLLPTFDGYRVLTAMRDDPELRDLPVLVVTARGSHSEAVVARELTITREGGLTIAEVMRWLKAVLDSQWAPGTIAPTSEAAPTA